MYCHDCGTANTVDSKYCKECGGKINDGYRTMMLSVQDMPADQSDENLDRLTRLLDMAFWHNEAGNRAAAITASEAALAINPNSTTAHSLLGTLYEKQGDDAQAIQHFEAVLALNPQSAADAAKLDQIRRGVHVKAVAPPVAHQLVPPALRKLGPALQQKWASSVGARPIPLQRRPLYAAGAAGVGVLAVGLLLMHPWASAEAVTRAPGFASAPSAPTAVRVAQSAFAGGMASGTAADVPVRPMVLLPGPSTTRADYAAPLLTTHDPFAGHLPAAESAVASSSRWSLPTVPSRAAARRRRAGGSGSDLPALRLAALPPAGSDGNLAPAAVALPAGVGTPLASVGGVPQHTVVVGSLAGAPPATTTSYLADPSSHIRITVHQVQDTETNDSVSPSDGGQSAIAAKAETYQQRALSLQQQGDYKQARTAYGSAIRAYQAQIASGRDVETAQRGLAACQTGLQICLQSQ